jgi:hypothetical protein
VLMPAPSDLEAATNLMLERSIASPLSLPEGGAWFARDRHHQLLHDRLPRPYRADEPFAGFDSSDKKSTGPKAAE